MGMNPEKQRIAIAEACGWKIEPHPQGRRLIHPDGHIVNKHYAEPWRLPDYLSDLNAMHEAEIKTFKTPSERCEYLCTLENVASRTRRPSNDGTIDPITQWACFSNSAQRAEAFLCTIGKWEED